MKRHFHSLFAAIGMLLLLLAPAGDAVAQDRPVAFGVQGGFADDMDFGIGGRAQYDLDPGLREGIDLIGSFLYFFPEDEGIFDRDYWELNADAVYVLRSADLRPYVGSGLNVARFSTDDGFDEVSDTELGLNLIGGLRVGDGFFAEARVQLSGGEQFLVTSGFVF